MPYKNIEDKREAQRRYREKYRDKLNEKKRQYCKDNKEKISASDKEYHKNNPHIGTINNWKRIGLIETEQYTYDQLYKFYMCTTHCELCDVELTDGIPYNSNTTRCMDHDHKTGLFRNILCFSCNIKRG